MLRGDTADESTDEEESLSGLQIRPLHACSRAVFVLGCLMIVAALVIVGTRWGRPAKPRAEPQRPHQMRAVPGAVGWNASEGAAAVGGGHWCRTTPPEPSWGLGQACGAGAPPLRVRTLSYNLFWWNLFGQRHGNHGSAGKLVSASGAGEPYDFIGFQECNDVGRVLADARAAGLRGDYGRVGPVDPGTGAVAIAYLTSRWRLLNFGISEVAEDSPAEWWGLRYVAYARLQHRTANTTVFFMNHHGPLPVAAPGGLCGPDATAYNLLQVAGLRSKPGDAIILLGDFNAGATSATVARLSKYMEHVYSGKSFGGVDNFFAVCAEATDKRNLGSGGSDHDALAVDFSIR